jgi:hypothetical protein
LHLSWQESGLPAPDGQRAMVRAATWCAGRWVVAGATADDGGHTRPAVWVSRDARSWQNLVLHPGGDFYAAQEILTSVACSRGRLAAIGSKSGGAHGMPRTATWQQRSDGSLAAVTARIALFAGSDTISVSHMSGGSDGYTVSGTRSSGAAVWRSATGSAFRLYAGAPGLSSTSRLQTFALDALPYRDTWLVAGQGTESTGRLRGMVWTGDGDGPWARSDLPGGSTVSTAERLVATPVGPDAAGLLDRRFGLWVLRNGSWALDDSFGSTDPNGTAASYVSGLAAPAGLVAATYSDGARFRLWLGQDVAMPAEVTVDGDRAATLVAHGSHLLLLTDDDTTGRAWLTTVPGPVQ